MKERHYIIATDLARLRIICDCLRASYLTDYPEEKKQMANLLFKMIDDLENKIDKLVVADE